jgi:hypothetical protein
MSILDFGTQLYDHTHWVMTIPVYVQQRADCHRVLFGMYLSMVMSSTGFWYIYGRVHLIIYCVYIWACSRVPLNLSEITREQILESLYMAVTWSAISVLLGTSRENCLHWSKRCLTCFPWRYSYILFYFLVLKFSVLLVGQV